MAIGIFANIASLNDYKTWFNEVNTAGMNFESPLGFNPSTGNNSAQVYGSTYMILKQRRKFVFEYYEKPGDKSPKAITMYINPENLTMNNSKLFAKQITRGGIFYHHFGTDHASLQLRGYTGLSGMAGIKQIEEVFYASGTLLAYNNEGNRQIYGAVSSFEVIDYKDPVSAVSSVNKTNYSSTMISQIQNRLQSENIDVDNNVLRLSIKLLDNINVNNNLSNFKDQMTIILNSMNNINSEKMNKTQYYQILKNELSKKLKNYDDSVLSQIAYDVSSLQYTNKNDANTVINYLIKTANNSNNNNIVSIASQFESQRRAALNDYITKLRKFQARDQEIINQLRAGLINIYDELTDKWLPRMITIYFENRAYLGFFDSFNYTRDAKTNLISYDIKFVVIKQYEFNNTNDGFSKPNNSVIVTPSPTPTPKPEPTPAPTPSPTPTPAPAPSYRTYIVKSGDVLELITSRFYSYSNYSELRKLTGQLGTYNNLYDCDSIFPGMTLKLPDKSELVNLTPKKYNGIVGDGK